MSKNILKQVYKSNRPSVGHENFKLTYSDVKLDETLAQVKDLLPEQATMAGHKDRWRNTPLRALDNTGIVINIDPSIKHLHGDLFQDQSIRDTRDILLSVGSALAENYNHVTLTEEDDRGQIRIWKFKAGEKLENDEYSSPISTSELLDRIRKTRADVDVSQTRATNADGITIMRDLYVDKNLTVRQALAYAAKVWQDTHELDKIEIDLKNIHKSKKVEDYYLSIADNISGYYRIRILGSQFSGSTTGWAKTLGQALLDLNAPLKKEHLTMISSLPKYYEYEIYKDKIAKKYKSFKSYREYEYLKEHPLYFVESTHEENPRYTATVFHFHTAEYNYIRMAIIHKKNSIEAKLLKKMLEENPIMIFTGSVTYEERDGFHYGNVTHIADIESR